MGRVNQAPPRKPRVQGSANRAGPQPLKAERAKGRVCAACIGDCAFEGAPAVGAKRDRQMQKDRPFAGGRRVCIGHTGKKSLVRQADCPLWPAAALQGLPRRIGVCPDGHALRLPWPQGDLARSDREPVGCGDKADMENGMVGVAQLKGQDMDTAPRPVRGRKP